MMKDGYVDVTTLSRLTEALLEVGPFRCEIATDHGAVLTLSPETAARPDGLLPVLVIGADAMWLSLTGRGLGIELRKDDSAALGYRLMAVHHGPLSAALMGLTLFLQRSAVDGVIRSDRMVGAWEDLRQTGSA